MTNETISISISQNSRSWIAIYQFLPPMAYFSHSLNKRYARACSSYECFILRVTRLSNKLLEQGYVKVRLKSSLKKFYGWYWDLIKMTICRVNKYNDNRQSDIILFLPNSTFNWLMRGFHKTFGVVCWQGMLNPPDIWSRPNWDFCGSRRVTVARNWIICLVLAYVILVETNLLLKFIIFPDYAIGISLGTFSILLSTLGPHGKPTLGKKELFAHYFHINLK